MRKLRQTNSNVEEENALLSRHVENMMCLVEQEIGKHPLLVEKVSSMAKHYFGEGAAGEGVSRHTQRGECRS